MFDVQIFPTEARMLIVARESWDEPEALGFHDAIREALAALSRVTRPLRIFADLSEHELLDSAVSEVNARTAAMITAARPDRYALVVSQAVLRLQARRLLAGASYQLFDRRDDAAAWLEWPLAKLDTQIEAAGFAHHTALTAFQRPPVARALTAIGR